jgi:hypothetical protein
MDADSARPELPANRASRFERGGNCIYQTLRFERLLLGGSAGRSDRPILSLPGLVCVDSVMADSADRDEILLFI